MQELAKIEQIITELQQDFDAIAMPRSAYVLEHLVVKERDTEPEQWAQCVLEMRIKYTGIKRTLLQIEKLELQIEDQKGKSPGLSDWDILLKREINETQGISDRLNIIEIKLLEISLEELQWTLTGQLREFFALHKIYQSFNKHYSREEIEQAQEDYWFRRLTRQAYQDFMADGRVSVGNQDALRQIKTVAQIENNQLRFFKISNNGNELDEPA